MLLLQDTAPLPVEGGARLLSLFNNAMLAAAGINVD